MNDLTPNIPPVTPAECGRCGSGEDVCAACDRALAELETIIDVRLELCSGASWVVYALRAYGIRCGQLGEFVHVEDVGLMRCPPVPSDADDAAKRDCLVALLADLAWEARHVR